MFTVSYRFVIVALTLVSVSWAKVDPEHKCLQKMPAAQCDLEVAFEGKQTGCVNLVKNSQKQPTLKCNKNLSGTEVLILMIDHDLPFAKYLSHGYVHWVAKGKVSSDGSIQITSEVPDNVYTRPMPACCHAHRYDMLVFSFASTTTVNVLKGTRFDKLCDFMKRNKLGYPKAAMSLRVISPDA